MTDVLSIRVVNFTGSAKQQIKSIRYTVFVEEQGVPVELEMDEHDPNATHMLGFMADEAVATGRILSDGHIGRIAVLKPFRSKGVGAAVVRKLAEYARQKSWPRVYLGSQLHAEGFYRGLGFSRYGDVFPDAGIDHCWMQAKPNDVT